LKISLIAAVSENNVIGLNNQLIWHLPIDLNFFKQTTLNSSIIMGRKTFDSIGKALPKRKNIVVTHNTNFTAPNITVVNSLQAAIDAAEGEEIFIVGGAVIFDQSMDLANKLYITKVHHTFTGDTYFPEIDPTIWQEDSRQEYPIDEQHAYSFSIVTYSRK
jgi:dihydrofolate reductase